MVSRMKGFIMNIMKFIGAIILIGGLVLHVYRAAKGEEWGEKIVIACLLIGFFLMVTPTLIEMGDRTCPSCETYYKADAKFCSECGTSLVTVCPDCASHVTPPFVELAEQRLILRPMMDNLIDPTGTPLTPSFHGKDCLGNGEHPGIECCCNECDHYLACFPAGKSRA